MGFAVAFALVTAAGLCTCLGASLALFAKVTDRRFLAGSLGAAAGVMMYISLVDILSAKTVDEFALYLDSNSDDPRPFRYANLCFFAGIVAAYALDVFVHQMISYLNQRNKQCSKAHSAGAITKETSDELRLELGGLPVESQLVGSGGLSGKPLHPTTPTSPKLVTTAVLGRSSAGVDDEALRNAEMMELLPEDQRIMLTKIGFLNMLAVGLHNMPEGLVTFIGYYHDPAAGIALAIAIALHNIPEGIVVGMPIYYATGSRMRAFAWTFVTGAFEILGGLLGWIIITQGSNSNVANAIMFGIVAGIMVFISIKELIPAALKFDPDNKITTHCFLFGGVVMATSLILLEI